MSKQSLTPLQRKAFFMALRPAAQEVGEEPEVYRKRILNEELGVEHLGEVSRNGDFDKLMARLWSDRGDYVRALGYSMGSLTRLRHLIVSAAERVVAAKGDWSGTAYDYIAGVMHQSGMAKGRPSILAARLASESGWLDFTEPQLKRLLMMLNTHIRRSKKGGAKWM